MCFLTMTAVAATLQFLLYEWTRVDPLPAFMAQHRCGTYGEARARSPGFAVETIPIGSAAKDGDGDAAERELLLLHVSAQRHRCAGTERDREVIIGAGARIEPAHRNWLTGDQSVTPRSLVGVTPQ